MPAPPRRLLAASSALALLSVGLLPTAVAQEPPYQVCINQPDLNDPLAEMPVEPCKMAEETIEFQQELIGCIHGWLVVVAEDPETGLTPENLASLPGCVLAAAEAYKAAILAWLQNPVTVPDLVPDPEELRERILRGLVHDLA